MISKPIVLGALAAACVTAAASGAYVAVRHNSTDSAVTTAAAPANAAPAPKTVAESEAIVTPASTPGPTDEAKDHDVTAPAKAPTAKDTSKDEPARTAPKKESPRLNSSTPTAVNTPTSSGERSGPPLVVEKPRDSTAAQGSAATLPQIQPEAPAVEAPVVPAKPQIVELVVPASSVVGLQMETSISSETARLEDRVEARVTRDVMADGRVAVPAGTKVLGDVVTVERGGKMKDKARLGVRFHTLVLADGSHVNFRTDSIEREGSSPGNESARKIGGAAIGGAILGAIIGGGKGAAIGGATGAGAGSAVVMAGDRNPATLPAGTVVNVRLTAPVTVDVEKQN